MGGITKSGDIHARTLLIEAAHSYRFPARITRRQLAAVDTMPEAVREIAWKAADAGHRHRDRTRIGRLRLVHCLHHVVSSCEDLCHHDNDGRGLANEVNRPIPVAASPAVEDHDAPCSTPGTNPCAR
jgi:hypothetical protein